MRHSALFKRRLSVATIGHGLDERAKGCVYDLNSISSKLGFLPLDSPMLFPLVILVGGRLLQRERAPSKRPGCFEGCPDVSSCRLSVCQLECSTGFRFDQRRIQPGSLLSPKVCLVLLRLEGHFGCIASHESVWGLKGKEQK